ncbi:MAG TPA: flagellar hook-basal body complex protein FliE [Acidimicrobiia bacterium]|nr:flagellar hook-basal body complex protein FliE [Acidimicrobiia bacterium]
MTIAAIGASAVSLTSLPTTPTLPTSGQVGWTGGFPDLPGATDPTAAAGAASGGAPSFGQVLGHAVDGLQAAQANADRLAVSAATGDLTNVHDYMIAATEASLDTELTVAVRNKAVDAFNQIMNMGV